MNNGRIYLSGGMEHAKDLGADWRESCSKILRKMNFDPLDITALDIAYSKKHGLLYNPNENQNELQRRSDIRKHFIYSDLELIKNQTDALIVYYDESARKGAGTISECQFSYLNDIPIFLVSAFGKEDVPGWLFGLSTRVFDSFDMLYKYLETLPDGILKRDRYGNRHSGNKYLCSLCGTPFEKHKHQYVSRVSPMYCGSCVDIIMHTHEKIYDRYEFFLELLDE